MRELAVYHGETRVGTLLGTENTVGFRYDKNWTSFPLSFGLPLREGIFSDNETRAYFANLMPEDRILDMLARKGRFSPHDILAFFDMYGKECAGALSIGEKARESIAMRDITDELHAFLRGKLGGTIQSHLKSRLSLAGAQDKLPVVFGNGRFFLPEGPTTHIVKTGNRDFPFLVKNEYFCLELARELGCATVEAKLVKLKDNEVLVIRRYDRENGRRLHQQDFCQALQLPPQAKYQGNGEFFGFSDMKRVCIKENVVFGDFFARALIVNFLLGNLDAHAKNFSLIFADKTWKLAPLYDLVCTEIYPDLDTSLAMAFGSALEKSKVGKSDMAKAASATGLDEAAFRALARDMALICRKAAPRLARIHDPAGKYDDFFKAVLRKILASCTKMLALTEKPKPRILP